MFFVNFAETDSQKKMEKYLPSSRMRDIIADNPLLLPVLSRFGIALGFGDNAVGDVCRLSGVDCPTFLAVANFISRKNYIYGTISLPSMIAYLKNAHAYFLDYALPRIRVRMIEAISSGTPNDISFHILKFYDEYVEEVRRHMKFEEDKVFVYVTDLAAGKRDSKFSIAMFRDHHLPIADKLHEIEELFICHFSAENGRIDLLNTLLFDIITCERDLVTHCRLEDELFIPAVEDKELSINVSDDEEPSQYAIDEKGDVVLTPRERDIIGAIAKGMSNKEIAEALFLSVHTVATHRRNICAKLNIHSASALTVYAIIHGLIPIPESGGAEKGQ